MTLLIHLVVCFTLAWILVEDLRRFVVRNVAVAALVVCFGLDCLVRHRLNVVLPHLVLAAFGLALMFGAFILRMMGGGDAKLFSAALLWVGPEGAFEFAVALFIATVLYAVGARAGLLPRRRAGKHLVVPFGPCISLAWLSCLALSCFARSCLALA